MLNKLNGTNKVVLFLLILIFSTCKKADHFIYYDYYMNDYQKPIGSFKINSSGECYYYVYYRSDGKRHRFIVDDVKKSNTWSFNSKKLILNGNVHTIVDLISDTLFVMRSDRKLFKLLKSNNQNP